MIKYPTKPYLLQIINHFGADNQNIHLGKEVVETLDAYEAYKANPCKETLMNLMEELSDCMVLAKQLAVSEYDIPLGEIAAMQPKLPGGSK